MITVPVIDRGPYTTGVYWDLTQATAQALDMTETSRIGTLY
jgi:rare lipoprotein A (peptidoglycan hydrolase)